MNGIGEWRSILEQNLSMNWRRSAKAIGTLLMLLGVVGYLLSHLRVESLARIDGKGFDREAMVEPLPTAARLPPLEPRPAPIPLPSPASPTDEKKQSATPPQPAAPIEKLPPSTSPGKGDVLYYIAEPTPTPRIFHQEEVEGDYPGRIEKGEMEPVRISFTRRMVEQPGPTDLTTTSGDRTQRTASIEPIPGRPLDLSLGENLGPGYEAWLRCQLHSESIEILPGEAAEDSWQPLAQSTRVDWEWRIRANSAAVQQEIEAVLEIEWRPRDPGTTSTETVRRLLWRERLPISVADPLLSSGQVRVLSPIFGGAGALLMLIAALPIAGRRQKKARSILAEASAETSPEGLPATSDALDDSPATSTSAPAANLEVPGNTQDDLVECSVFAPAIAPQGETLMIQVFAHLEGRDSEAASLAVQFDPTARSRGVKTLSARVARGAELTFHLELSRISLPDPIQTLVWMGDTESVQFIVDIPNDCHIGNLAGKVTISQNTVPIGRISFLLQVVPAGTPVPVATELETSAFAYRSTFISYASEDRDKVLARVQMLDQMGIRYFQDLLSLDPGQRWEKELYRNIDQCDLFLLFWSNAAKRSPWVMKEVNYALDRQQGNDEAPPEIKPVIIEGPPPVEPPERLQHLHFNDKLIYLMTRDPPP
jgi:hypothetical protein